MEISQTDPLKTVLRSQDCLACRLCCRFSLNDKFDAPTFTSHEKILVKKMFPQIKLRFAKVGRLWKIKLNRLRDRKKARFICPLYDPRLAKCRIYHVRPFDCVTWPFYIMKKQNKYFITLSKDCPIVWEKLSGRSTYVKKVLTPYLLSRVRKYPELVTGYHGNTKILLDVTKAINQR